MVGLVVVMSVVVGVVVGPLVGEGDVGVSVGVLVREGDVGVLVGVPEGGLVGPVVELPVGVVVGPLVGDPPLQLPGDGVPSVGFAWHVETCNPFVSEKRPSWSRGSASPPPEHVTVPT